MTCNNANALSATDIDDLSTNVKAINDWAEGGTNGSGTMANGRVVPSPANVIAKARLYKTPGTYPGAAASITDLTEPFASETTGLIYAPNQSLTTTGATLDAELAGANASKWYLIAWPNASLSIDDLSQLGDIGHPASTVYVDCAGFYNGDGLGLRYEYRSATSKASHNGGTIIAAAWFTHYPAGAPGDANWWTAPATGSDGCFHLLYDGAVNVKWFGAKGDGTSASATTNAIQAAITLVTTTGLSGNGGSVYIPSGSYLISSTLTITGHGITIFGDNGTAVWNGVTSVYEHGSKLIKDAAMAADAIEVASGLGFTLENIAIIGVAGNTGDGVYLNDGQTARLNNVSISKMGGVGVRIGPKTADGNVNGWQLVNVTSQYNGSHGVYIYDNSPTVAVDGPDANAGTATGLNVAGNGGSGLYIENGLYNTFTGLLSQQNTAYGVVLVGTASLSLYNTFVGGDIESNGSGNWSVGANAKHTHYIGPATGAPSFDVDANFGAIVTGGLSSFRTIFTSGVQFPTGDTIDTYQESVFTPTVAGTTTAGVNTYVWQDGWYTKIGNIVHFHGVVRLSAKGTGGNAMAGDIIIDGLPVASKDSPLSRPVVNLIIDGGVSPTVGYSPFYVGKIHENEDYIRLFELNTTDSSNIVVPPTDITDTFIVYFSGTYLTD